MSCPACKAPLKEEETQCPACGIILSKWKDPKQRAAEARLAALAAESSQGLPKSLTIGLLLAVIVPLLVIFVPDIGVPLRGAKLRYHLAKGETVRHKSTALLTQSPLGAIAEQLETQFETLIEARESDTGGNMTLRKNFQHVSVTPISAGRPALEKTDLGTWEGNWVMSPRGTLIETMVTTNAQMQNNNNNMKRLNQMRVENNTYYADYGIRKPTPAGPPPVTDPYEKILEETNAQQFAHLDQATLFQWPVERVGTGFTWQQSLRAVTLSPTQNITWTGGVGYRIAKFERTARGYMVVIEWDSPLKVDANNTTSQGNYKGKAQINYENGFIDRLDGELSSPTLGTSVKINITRL